MSSYLTDDATDSPASDALYFSDFRPALKEILTAAQTPLTVGVFGTWGSGKTSLMRMLRDEIEAEGKPAVRSAWFTAWKYDRHDVLWRAFILRVLDALYPREPGSGPREARPVLAKPTPKQQQQIELLERLEESVYETVEWQEIGPRQVKWWQLLSNTGKAGSEIAATLATAGLYPQLKKLIGGDETPVEELQKAAEAISKEMKTRQRRQLFHMEQFEESFKEAVQLLGKGGRLVVFVDDLDRCLPEKAIEVLEAIKLFLEVPGAVFILGMDQEVVQRGVEARYGSFFHQSLGERSELPIRGDVYLQKIVQIPFHLPARATEDMAQFIAALDGRLAETTGQVFARGLFPNPRQVKRALNIFRLLQQIALTREERGGLRAESIAWPLLAKTVVIQTQYPELYQQWRQYPTLVQTLEAEYGRHPASEEETLLGRLRPKARPEVAETGAGTVEEPAAPERSGGLPSSGLRHWPPTEVEEPAAPERSGGLLAAYLEERQRYTLLEQMLAYPVEEAAGAGRERARFAGLSREQMAAYVRLAGAVESKPAAVPVDVPADLLAEMLSGDAVRLQDATARVTEQEKEPDGPLHQAFRGELLDIIRNPEQLAAVRASAGNALGQLGDLRFRPEAWYLPDEPLLGFVEIPAGPFLMGSDQKEDSQAQEQETPQHKVTLPAYYIARYPVTVAQFRAYVEAGGHPPANPDSLRGPDNHPVIWLTWREALIYGGWLTEQLRTWAGMPEPLRTLLREGQNGGQPWRITLPSEAEWEKAARGEDGRLYPWGNDFDPERANTTETNIGSFSAVGCFPGGASPYGLLDLSGNVWEWTRSLWGEQWDKPEWRYPYKADDDREKLEAPDQVARVLRGGSSYHEGPVCRCAFRYRLSTFGRSWNVGFRLVASPVTSDL